MKKIFLLSIILLVSLTENLMAELNEDSSKLYGGVGIGYGYGMGYEAFLEYRSSSELSFYFGSQLFSDVSLDSDEGDKLLDVGDIQTIGMQVRFSYFLVGYHFVSHHNVGIDILEESTQAYSLGLLNSWESWELGATFHYLNGKVKSRDHVSAGGFFIRKKFSL